MLPLPPILATPLLTPDLPLLLATTIVSLGLFLLTLMLLGIIRPDRLLPRYRRRMPHSNPVSIIPPISHRRSLPHPTTSPMPSLATAAPRPRLLHPHAPNTDWHNN